MNDKNSYHSSLGVRKILADTNKWNCQYFLENQMKKYQCIVCGWIYDEAEGWPQDGIAAGTKWEDIPDDWTCPDCGVSKADFEMIEI